MKTIKDKHLTPLLKIIEETLKEDDGSWMPQLDYIGTKGHVVVKLADFPQDHYDKCRIFLGLGTKFGEEKKKHGYPDRLIFSAEAWMGNSEEDAPPSKQKGRKEVVMIVTYEVGEAARDYAQNKTKSKVEITRGYSYEIIRTKTGKFKELKLLHDMKGYESPFFPMFMAGFAKSAMGIDVPPAVKAYMTQKN